MIKVGLTGGIGSGKTVVSKVFLGLGVPVFNSDLIAKELLEKPEVIQVIVASFGEDVMVNKKVSRKILAERVFASPELLHKLNGIIHPLVGKCYSDWLDKHNECELTIKEAAVLFESGAYKQLNKVINVSAPRELRIKRVIKRDGTDKESVINRMNAQLSEEEREKLADYTILNDNVSAIIPQVMSIYQKLIS